MVLARDGSLLKAFLSPDDKWRFRTEVSELPKHVTDGLLCLEDRYFHWHPGVNPFSVARALKQNFDEGRVVSGASTLTMQVTRLMNPRPRVWNVKIQEAVSALRLDLKLSKSEILNLYLSYAPFGRNLEGLEAAARRYFSKSASRLNPAESAFLFLLPQAPKRWSAKETETLKLLRARNLERYAECGVISREDQARWSLEPVPEWNGAYETHASHLASWAASLKPSADRVETTIDAGVQRVIEELVSEGEAGWRSLGVLNVGLLVIDNATGEIVAAIGNFDAARTGDAQQFASFLVPRSTGSLLKTFLYGRLLESGEVLPETLLEDVPLDLNGYRPKNYNGEFSGLVEARMALVDVAATGTDNLLALPDMADVETLIRQDLHYRDQQLLRMKDEVLDLELISAFEVTLSDARADEAHPAFMNLFVETGGTAGIQFSYDREE